jgi:hypothetical protein
MKGEGALFNGNSNEAAEPKSKKDKAPSKVGDKRTASEMKNASIPSKVVSKDVPSQIL